jgi:hypothetical protein
MLHCVNVVLLICMPVRSHTMLWNLNILSSLQGCSSKRQANGVVTAAGVQYGCSSSIEEQGAKGLWA